MQTHKDREETAAAAAAASSHSAVISENHRLRREAGRSRAVSAPDPNVLRRQLSTCF